MTAAVFAADTFALADGSQVSGDIVKFDDYEVMFHTTSDTYTNIQWPRFSQDALKQLAQNPKYRQFAAPFIEPTAAERPAPPKINIRYEQPVKLPEHPSILGGMFQSSLGLFILLIVYAANLYAAYEVAIVRGKPPGLVIGLAAVLPIIGPIIFLSQPVKSASVEEAPPEEAMPGAPAPGTPAPVPGQEDVQVVPEAPARQEKKLEPQVFSRGKFTLNKRFIETKFAGFIGEPKGDAKTYSMEIKTPKGTVAVECIKQLALSEAILETPHGQLTVAFNDIQEIKLIPKPA